MRIAGLALRMGADRRHCSIGRQALVWRRLHPRATAVGTLAGVFLPSCCGWRFLLVPCRVVVLVTGAMKRHAQWVERHAYGVGQPFQHARLHEQLHEIAYARRGFRRLARRRDGRVGRDHAAARR
jgi:hypothetical protein